MLGYTRHLSRHGTPATIWPFQEPRASCYLCLIPGRRKQHHRQINNRNLDFVSQATGIEEFIPKFQIPCILAAPFVKRPLPGLDSLGSCVACATLTARDGR